MSVAVTFNNVNYTIPTTNDRGWGSSVTSWIQGVCSAALQKSGGTFTLTADVDFGASYGLKSAYYKSRNSNVASAGILRLGNTELIASRNAANDGNVTLGVTASDVWQSSVGLQLSANSSCTLTSSSTNFVMSGGLQLSGNSSATITSNSTDVIVSGGLRFVSSGGVQLSTSSTNLVTSGNLYIATTGGALLQNSSTSLRVDGGFRVGGSVETSAIVEFSSTTKGFLPPRMTGVQRDAIATPAAGLIIYNTTTNKLNVYTTAWEVITSA